jgi:hypothetical protein
VVPSIQSGKYQVSVPCAGDKSFAMAQDYEMIFSLPMGKIEELLTGIRAGEEWGLRLPFIRAIQPEFEWPENYIRTGNDIGMEWLKPSTKEAGFRNTFFGRGRKE